MTRAIIANSMINCFSVDPMKTIQ